MTIDQYGSPRRRRLDLLGRAALDTLAVLVPVTCAGCGEPDRPVCEACRAALRPAVRRLDRAGVTIWAAHAYGGVVARVIGAYKDAGRTDAGPALAGALLASVRGALAAVTGGARAELCVIPSTPAARRARGYEPVPRLLASAGLRPARVLRLARGRVDQAALGVEARRRNAEGGLAIRTRVAGRRLLIVDDVVTTGSTLAEAARTLRDGGADVIGAAVIAETPRRTPAPDQVVRVP